MNFPNIPLHICVNEGERIAIIEVFRCEVSPYTAHLKKAERVFISGEDADLPEYRREPMASEYEAIEKVANEYNVYRVDCADYVPTVYFHGKKWEGIRWV